MIGRTNNGGEELRLGDFLVNGNCSWREGEEMLAAIIRRCSERADSREKNECGRLEMSVFVGRLVAFILTKGVRRERCALIGCFFNTCLHFLFFVHEF